MMAAPSSALRGGIATRQAAKTAPHDLATPIAEQLAAGREARRHCPRSSHGPGRRTRLDRDAVALLIESNDDRLADLVPVRHSRMLESPFAFFRGSAILQAHDLAQTPTSGIEVQACGDCHLMNFGGFASPERSLIFDINDFDETHLGPWEWDVKRLTVSLVLAARWRGFSPAVALEAATAAAGNYRAVMREYAGLATLETWYSQITFDDIAATVRDEKAAKRLVSFVKVARSRTSEHTFHKLATGAGGTPHIVDQPPLLYHPPGVDVKAAAEPFLKRYAGTLRHEYQQLLARFRVVDAALKVVGVGSVGTRCYIVLLLGPHDDPLFLQVKEARHSVLERYVRRAAWKHQGERVVAGQRLMQAVSDIFLGWASGPGGRDFYVRQLRDMKIAADLSKHDAKMLIGYGRLCGRALARGHAKSGSAGRIAGYLGGSPTFDEAIARYSVTYADQVERDYGAFRAAARTGRIATEPSERR